MARGATRLKIVSTPLPASRDEVNALIFEIGEEQRARQAIQTRLEETIANLKKTAEAEAKAHSEAIAEKIGRVHAWCLANREEITDDGKTKTVKFGNGEVSWRLRPPGVTLMRGIKAEDVISSLQQLGKRFAKFLRWKVELNKEAILDDPDLARIVPGIRIGSAGEDFAVKPIALQLEEVVR